MAASRESLDWGKEKLSQGRRPAQVTNYKAGQDLVRFFVRRAQDQRGLDSAKIEK